MSHNNIRRKTAKVIALLMDGELTIREICAETGLHYETVRPFVNELRAAGVVHVAQWRRGATASRYSAVYRLGRGVDAPDPQPKRPVKRPPKFIATSVFDYANQL